MNSNSDSGAVRAMISLASLSLSFAVVVAPPAGVADTPFVQQYHEPYRIGGDSATNDVRSVAVDGEGNIDEVTQRILTALHKGEPVTR